MGGMFGLHGPAPLFLMPACLGHRLLRGVTVIRGAFVLVGVTSLHGGIASGAGVPRLAQGSPRTRLTVLRPARIVPASGSGGGLVRAEAPRVARGAAGVRGPAFEPRWSEQRRGGVAFGESGAHGSLARDGRSDGVPGEWMEVEQRKRGQSHLHVQPGGPPARIHARCYHASGHLTEEPGRDAADAAAVRSSVQLSFLSAAVRVPRRTRAKFVKATSPEVIKQFDW